MHWRHKGSHLHNNDASLVSRSAHVLCWQCALALSLSVRRPGRASPAVWLAGFAPLAACLAMTHVAVFRLTPNAAGRPSVTSYAYGLCIIQQNLLQQYKEQKLILISESAAQRIVFQHWPPYPLLIHRSLNEDRAGSTCKHTIWNLERTENVFACPMNLPYNWHSAKRCMKGVEGSTLKC